MIGWSVSVGPRARERDPEELAAAIERIPLPSGARRGARRSTAISARKNSPSCCRVALGVAKLEIELGKRDYVGRTTALPTSTFSIRPDSLPISQPGLASKEANAQHHALAQARV
jgi:glutathione S-transferase/GST-like protein